MLRNLSGYDRTALSAPLNGAQVPDHWAVGRVKDVCRLAYGDALPAEVRLPGPVQVMGSNGPIGKHAIPNTSGRTIVVGRKGSHGKVRVVGEPVWVMDTAYF